VQLQQPPIDAIDVMLIVIGVVWAVAATVSEVCAVLGARRAGRDSEAYLASIRAHKERCDQVDDENRRSIKEYHDLLRTIKESHEREKW